jgi:mannose-6-phosphate isomerase-like protein (cupin superfamily)
LTPSKATTIYGHHIRLEEALSRIPGPEGERFAELFRHGSLSVEIFGPRGVDSQQPHSRDEVYVVVHGTGSFLFNNERVAFGPGDLLFVPAGVVHRFEKFSDDLLVWVLFYGPPGGEGSPA